MRVADGGAGVTVGPVGGGRVRVSAAGGRVAARQSALGGREPGVNPGEQPRADTGGG